MKEYIFLSGDGSQHFELVDESRDKFEFMKLHKAQRAMPLTHFIEQYIENPDHWDNMGPFMRRHCAIFNGRADGSRSHGSCDKCHKSSPRISVRCCMETWQEQGVWYLCAKCVATSHKIDLGPATDPRPLCPGMSGTL